MSDVVDIIDRSASPADAARVAAVVESYFLPCGCCASTRSSLMHPDEPAPHVEYFEHKPELMRWRGLFDSLMPFRRT